MYKITKLSVLMFILAQFVCVFCFAQGPSAANEQGDSQTVNAPALSDKTSEDKPAEVKKPIFQGSVNADGVNIRFDSTASAEIICRVEKKETLDIMSESYDWYKIRLPRNAPAYIKKDYLAFEEGKPARISGDNVNIRLRPDISSAILGKATKEEKVKVLQTQGEWAKIEPISNSYGWIHKNFVRRIAEKKEKQPEAANTEAGKQRITVEGIVKPKTMTRVATHKLTSSDNKLYLLKSKKEDLDVFNNRKVKITGIVEDPSRNNPIIEVEKVEALE